MCTIALIACVIIIILIFDFSYSKAQYIFTHDAMLEVIECGETEVAATDLKERFW